MLTLEEVKNYLRVTYDEDDALIQNFIDAAGQLCMDIIRTDDPTVLETDKNARLAMLYTVAYLYEHREEADHNGLALDLRSLLFGSRKAGF